MLTNDYRNGFTRKYNPATGETVFADTPIFIKDDFIGGSYNTTMWTTVDQSLSGAPTVAKRQDIATGELAFTIAGTNEAEDIGISWGDNRGIDLTKRPYVEFKVAPATVFGASDSFFAGINSDHVNTSAGTYGYAAATINAGFVFSTSGFIGYHCDDNLIDSGVVPTQIARTTGSYYLCSIDFFNLETVQFKINNLLVGTTNMKNMRTTNTLVQPYFVVEKKSGLTVPAAYLDYFVLCSER